MFELRQALPRNSGSIAQAGADPAHWHAMHLNTSFQAAPEKPTIKCDKSDTTPCCVPAVGDSCLLAFWCWETWPPTCRCCLNMQVLSSSV